MKIFQICLAIVLALMLNQVNSNECSLDDEEFFVTFHPHLDAFWLNTDD